MDAGLRETANDIKKNWGEVPDIYIDTISFLMVHILPGGHLQDTIFVGMKYLSRWTLT